MPYILNGEVYYNCSVNEAESNDLGCYHGHGQSQWVKCQQPQGMYVVKFCHVCYINRGIIRRQIESAHVMFNGDQVMLFDRTFSTLMQRIEQKFVC